LFALDFVGEVEVRARCMPDDSDRAVSFRYTMRIDDILWEAAGVTIPGHNVRWPSCDGRLAKNDEFVVFGHRFAEAVCVSPIDAVDEVDDCSDGGKRAGAH